VLALAVPRPTANATPATAMTRASPSTTLTIRLDLLRGFGLAGTTGAGEGARSGAGANGLDPVGPAGDGWGEDEYESVTGSPPNSYSQRRALMGSRRAA
jgi:hypothetical protein